MLRANKNPFFGQPPMLESIAEALSVSFHTYWALDWIQPAIAYSSSLLIGRKKKYGWLIGLVATGIWCILGILSQQSGTIFWSVPWFVLGVWAYWKWRRDELTQKHAPQTKVFVCSGCGMSHSLDTT